MNAVEQFLSHKATFDAIQSQRSDLEAARRVAADADDWDTYDALEAQIDETFDAASDHNMAMSALVGTFTAEDKAAIKAAQ